MSTVTDTDWKHDIVPQACFKFLLTTANNDTANQFDDARSLQLQENICFIACHEAEVVCRT